MKVTDHIRNSKSCLFSFEILPPLKGQDINSLFNAIDPLMEFNPPFINVTYHREDYVFKKLDNGLLEKRTVRKRPGTVGICAAIMNRYKVDAVPHLICGGFTKEETENALIDLNFLGIDNVLVLRGDPIKSEGTFIPEPDGHKHASDLISQVVNMNNGKYLDHDLQNSSPSDFCIGVAAYPEKHSEAPNIETDLKYLKLKQDLGADFIVTQMFFNNSKYIEFVENCRKIGITIPIIPGLKPITTVKQINVLPSVFHIDIPVELSREVEKCKNPEAVKQVGIEWSINQSKELIKFGVPILHFYSMGKSDSVKQVGSALF
jgi:methylenetetrahydrofolate reductase (NADPH)